jgi:RNA polymerase-interacting CarD/CdnL/TRCF family regulator
MDKQTITQPSKNPSTDSSSGSFAVGTTVIYPMHGKCTIVATENRQIGGQSVPFYRIEIQKSSFSRSARQEPTIWVPVASAKERGLRLPISTELAQAIYQIFANREYYFDPHQSWAAVLPQLEQTIRTEGGIGLAKVASYLFVVKKKQIVPTQEVAKFSESVNRMLFRELSEATGETIREIEVKTTKAMRSKLLPDN